MGIRVCNSLLHDLKQLPTHLGFVSALREMYRSTCCCFIAFVFIFYLIDYLLELFCDVRLLVQDVRLLGPSLG
jgi:hypothetical protein